MPEIKFKIQNSKFKIISQERIKDRYYKLVLRAPEIAKRSQPGQFLQIKVDNRNGPLLRRPFSIHSVGNGNIEILYELVGEGTVALSRRRTAELLDIIGPLGNGFDLRLAISNKRQAILVAGGMGVAPLFFLAEKIRMDYPKSDIQVLLGAKAKDEVLCEKEFKRLGCSVKIATDDGSVGFKGKATDLLKRVLPLAICDKRLAIYACGPRPMLKEISRLSRERRIPAEVSLEEHLACGIGACLGCVVETRAGFRRVCKEGPVFKVSEIIW